METLALHVFKTILWRKAEEPKIQSACTSQWAQVHVFSAPNFQGPKCEKAKNSQLMRLSNHERQQGSSRTFSGMRANDLQFQAHQHLLTVINTCLPFGKYRPVATLIKGAHSITDVVAERRHTFTHFGEEPGRG